MNDTAPRSVSLAYLNVLVMVRSLLLLITFGVGIASNQVHAEQPTTEALARWVTDLSSNSRTVRTSAEAELIRLGPAVIELLPSPSTVTDPEVRASLDRVVRAIEQAESEAAIRPQTVDWSQAKSLTEAIENLKMATGNHLAVPPLEHVRATAPYPTEPLHFWEAINWLEAHTQLRYEPGQLALLDTPVVALPMSVEGAFRVQLVSAETRTTATGTKLLGVKLRTTCEPRLRPLFLMAAVDDWSVLQKDSACAAFTPHARLEIPADHSGAIDVSFDFVVPASIQAVNDWTISGQLELTLSARSTPVIFSDLTAKLPLIRRRGQASLSLLSVKSDEAGCSVRIASAFPEMSGLFESYRASLLAPELTLELTTGRPLTAIEVTQVQEDPQGIVLESRFPGPLPVGARLQALVPTAISTQKIPFQLERVTPVEVQ